MDNRLDEDLVPAAPVAAARFEGVDHGELELHVVEERSYICRAARWHRFGRPSSSEV